jgi:hypothetical protein
MIARIRTERVSGSIRVPMVAYYALKAFIIPASAVGMDNRTWLQGAQVSRRHVEVQFDAGEVINGGDQIAGFNQCTHTDSTHPQNTVKRCSNVAVIYPGFDFPYSLAGDVE